MLAKELKPNMSSQLSQIAAVWSRCSQRNDTLQMDRELTFSWDRTVSPHLLSVAGGLRTLISRPQVNIAPYSSLSVLSLHVSSSLFHPSHFSHVLSFFYFCHPPPCRLSLLGSEKECSSAGGDLTQHASWLWLRRAIYKWLLINPRPTLMLSHIFSSPLSRTFACISMFGQTYADRCEWKAMKIPRLCQQPAVT